MEKIKDKKKRKDKGLKTSARSATQVSRSGKDRRDSISAWNFPWVDSEKTSLSPFISATLKRRMQEGGFIIFAAVSLFLFISLFTYHDADPGWSKTTVQIAISNSAGKMGAWFSDLFLFLFGYMAYLFPVIIGLAGFRLINTPEPGGIFSRVLWMLRCIGFVVALLAGCGLTHLYFDPTHSFASGGILGESMAAQFLPAFGLEGSTILMFAFFLSGITLATGLSWFGLMDLLALWISSLLGKMREKIPKFLNLFKKIPGDKVKNEDNEDTKGIHNAPLATEPTLFALPNLSQSPPQNPLALLDIVDIDPTPLQARFDHQEEDMDGDLNPSIAGFSAISSDPYSNLSIEVQAPTPKKRNPPKEPKLTQSPTLLAASSITKTTTQAHALPTVDLLEKPQSKHILQYSPGKLDALSREVEARLLEFGVQVRVVAVLPGPVITRFELDLAAGVKVSKISGLAKDLARALSVTRVRVVEVIPGKSVVGLEIPNPHRETVYLREILESNAYEESQSPLTLALGKDISGDPVVANLAKMPHLLVAGTTGSGKSVGVNAMLLSLLFKSSPKDVRLILIDPKMLELSIYDGIPHLLTPVVTDMKDAANVLRWCVGEMERRYQMMAAVGVRNLAGFNRKVVDAEEAKKPLLNPLWRPEMGGEAPPLEYLPHIVVIIDEFADMMMVVGKKVEELIARIAQKARAAGIHMILATQRPSVDVITGLIKANVPTRIAFQVSSRIDSRTILDQQGAEQLLGHGDMLYLPPGSGIPIRIHGAFVSDEEVHHVVKALKALGEPDYAEDILGSGGLVGATTSGGFSGTTGSLTGGNLGGGGGFGSAFGSGFNFDGDGEQDELYDQAVQIVIESRRASVSNLQRRLKIGYNRAARLIDTMETAGVVSAMQSNGAREVLSRSLETED